MTVRSHIVLGLVAVFGISTAFAQDIRDDEADVFLAIERQWDATLAGDQNEVDDMLADTFMGWNKNSPAPRSKRSTSKWSRFVEDEVGRLLRYELYPLSITVHGDVALAHYLYSSAFKPKGGDVKMANGRYTDVLIRSGDDWKFIAWQGGDD